MKIVNRLTGQVYNVKNIDFNSGVIFGNSQAYQWANEKSELRVLETDVEFKSLVEELTTTEILNLPQYADYCKLTDYTGGWSEYPTCIQRLFATKDDIVFFSMYFPDFIRQMRQVEPYNPILEFDNGSLIYFYTELAPDVLQLMQSRNIVVENRPVNCDINGKLETSLVPIPEILDNIELELINPQPQIY